jgi:hypothetical protein
LRENSPPLGAAQRAGTSRILHMSIEIAGTPPPRPSTTEAKKRSLDVSISPPLDRLANGPGLYRTIRVAGPGPKRQGETAMRFMMIVKATKDSEAGVMPDEKLIDAMTKYNEELFKAGALLDGMGLHPSSKGARVKFSGGKTIVTEGPFAETKELIAGYWLIQVKSREEAIEWARRIPPPHGAAQESEVELRQVFELDDFPPSPAIDRERELEKQLAKKKQGGSAANRKP